jgi:RNA-directed DNA polymerase
VEGRTSPRHYASHDAEAQADGEREQDAGLQAAGKEVRLSGIHVGALLLAADGRAYLGTTPSKQRVQRMCAAISQTTRRSQTQQDVETLVGRLNREIIGWANYFCLGPVSKAYRAVDRHTRRRLRQWLCAKHKLRGLGTMRYPDERLHDEFGLVRLVGRTASLPWATTRAFSESRMR